ncbi:hypothetical protein Y032_0072g671 [Ancylostoma ceylanicum]|uniref:Uncharacterized protein n=1 Tax=Ancylostoma ceylanicum TaxID=53326 RepID=A0A016TVM9_9BILA|nr:hypothetical protein Y032_0072g671 [Ancylostoma ceylanicum]
MRARERVVTPAVLERTSVHFNITKGKAFAILEGAIEDFLPSHVIYDGQAQKKRQVPMWSVFLEGLKWKADDDRKKVD